MAANDLDGGFVDARALSAAGPVVFDGATFVVATIGGDLTLCEFQVSADTTFDHAVLNGDVDAVEASFDGELGLRDVRGRDNQVAFDGTTIGGKADFAYVNYLSGIVSMAGAVFGGEVWFTHASFSGAVSLSDAVRRRREPAGRPVPQGPRDANGHVRVAVVSPRVHDKRLCRCGGSDLRTLLVLRDGRWRR